MNASRAPIAKHGEGNTNRTLPPRSPTPLPSGARDPRLVGRLGLFLLCASMTAAAFAAEPTPQRLDSPFTYKASRDIPCSGTPFGRQLVIGEDRELITLIQPTGATQPRRFQEWTLPENPGNPSSPALVESLSASWTQNGSNALTSTTLLKAVAADMDGDGAHEVVVATRISGGTGNGHLRLGVFRRTGPSGNPGIELIDTWDLSATFSSVELLAGDLDGSQDGRDELALLVRRNDTNRLHLYILTGANGGTIDHADNQFAGHWDWSPAGRQIGVHDMALGDFLLNDRSQIAVVAESTTADIFQRKMHYHLLEFESETQPMLPVQVGHQNIAAIAFETTIGIDLFNATIDQHGIHSIQVNAGDVAGDASDELLVHYEARHGNSDTYRVIQRLHHFKVMRDALGDISDIDLARRPGNPILDHDYSHLVRQNEYTPGAWDVSLVDLGNSGKKRIAFVHAIEGDQGDTLNTHIYESDIELKAGFSYYQSGRDVQFTDRSMSASSAPVTPPSGQPRWEFGDGNTSNDINPVHRYTNPGTYTVRLRLWQNWNDTLISSEYSIPVTVTNSGQSEGGGVDLHDVLYQIERNPSHVAQHDPPGSAKLSFVSAQPANLNKDGHVELLSTARWDNFHGPNAGILRSVWRIDGNAPAVPPSNGLVGKHLLTPSTSELPNQNIGNLLMVAADFDGDSHLATLGSECRHVTEANVRSLIWAPPWFSQLQSERWRAASFGRTVGSGSGVEQRFGTFTSHDVSGYIGLEIEAGFVEAAVRFTAGRNLQKARGSFVGTENTFTLTEGRVQTTEGSSGLLVSESNQFECYMYDVRQAGGMADPHSSIRLCEHLSDNNETFIQSSDPDTWDTAYPLTWASHSQGHPPPNWAPLTREWANIALFRSVRSNASFVGGSHAGIVTDGKYTTLLESQERHQPFVEIDLGSIRDVANIRIMPEHGELAGELSGYRVYTSLSPMPDTGLPSGSGVRVFAPESAFDATYDRWNIWTRHWNPSDPNNAPGDPMKARYIRLQHPGNARLKLSQIQVFGNVHVEPPGYPDAICDPVDADGLFSAKVWDRSASVFRAIEVHGDILWNGTILPGNPGLGWTANGSALPGCINHAALQSGTRSKAIWPQESIGDTGTSTWDLSTEQASFHGTDTSFESSTRVGAEFELSVGAIVSVVSGVAYEFTRGVTEEHQSVTYWSEGLNVGGEVQGFQNIADNPHCRYNARPYAFRLTDRSNTGYLHTAYAVDYVVPEAAGATAWTRATVPERCLPDATVDDRIFGNGFEN